jgi:hypothetical protein
VRRDGHGRTLLRESFVGLSSRFQAAARNLTGPERPLSSNSVVDGRSIDGKSARAGSWAADPCSTGPDSP